MLTARIDDIAQDDDGYMVFRVQVDCLEDLRNAVVEKYKDTHDTDSNRVDVSFCSHSGSPIRDGELLRSGLTFSQYIDSHAQSYYTPIVAKVRRRRKRQRSPSTTPAPVTQRSLVPRLKIVFEFNLVRLGDLLPLNVERLPLDSVELDLHFFAPHNRDFKLKKAICWWYKVMVFEQRSHLRRLRIHQDDDNNVSFIVSGYTQLGKTKDQCVLLILIAMCSCIPILVVRVSGGDGSFQSFRSTIEGLADEWSKTMNDLIATNQLPALTYEQLAFFHPEILRASSFGRAELFTGNPADGKVLGHRASPLIVMGRANPSDLSYTFDPQKLFRKRRLENIGTHLDAEIMKFPGAEKRRYGLLFDEGELTVSSAKRYPISC